MPPRWVMGEILSLAPVSSLFEGFQVAMVRYAHVRMAQDLEEVLVWLISWLREYPLLPPFHIAAARTFAFSFCVCGLHP